MKQKIQTNQTNQTNQTIPGAPSTPGTPSSLGPCIEVLLPILKEAPGVEAIFLKGSHAKGVADAYSDIDLYCVVKAQAVQDFLKARIHYLEAYQPLLYWSEANFVGPQIVAVYENHLHIDLYTVTRETLPTVDKALPLWDPEAILKDYQERALSLTPDSLVKHYHEFSFTCLEFYTAYKRGDLIWASRLTSHMSGNLAFVLRHLYDPNYAQLGFKRLEGKLPKPLAHALKQALDQCGPHALPRGAQDLVTIATSLLESLPQATQDQINLRFFKEMATKIKTLD